MAIVIVNEMQGGNEEFYEQVSAKVMPGGGLPEGCQLHIAGPLENGGRGITVWNSEEPVHRAHAAVPSDDQRGRALTLVDAAVRRGDSLQRADDGGAHGYDETVPRVNGVDETGRRRWYPVALRVGGLVALR